MQEGLTGSPARRRSPPADPVLAGDPVLGCRRTAREIAAARGARARLEVDLDAVRHNLGVIARLSPGARVMAVVKGDGYGLGAAPLAHALRACGVAGFAVDNAAEGIALRAAGIAEPIVVLDGDVPDNAALAVAHGLLPGIAHDSLLSAFDQAAERRGVTHPVWLVANVGFNRSGYSGPAAFARFAARAAACKHLEVRGVYAHLTHASGDAAVSRRQIDEFAELVRRSRRVLGPRLETSLFASHGLVRWGGSFPTDWVRPGVLLYGEHSFTDELIEPEARAAVRDLLPAVRLRARIVHLLEFDREVGIGYGHRHRARPGQRLATVAFGFGGGYPGNSGLEALLAGRRIPVFGDPGMDALQVDATGVPGVRLGGWVTLIGTEGGEHISATELAERAGLSPYQLLSRLSCHRCYLSSGESVQGDP